MATGNRRERDTTSQPKKKKAVDATSLHASFLPFQPSHNQTLLQTHRISPIIPSLPLIRRRFTPRTRPILHQRHSRVDLRRTMMMLIERLLLLLIYSFLVLIHNDHHLDLLLLLLLDRKDDPCSYQSLGLLPFPSNHRDVRRIVKLGFSWERSE